MTPGDPAPLVLLQERELELQKEQRRQEENDKLRQEFAQHANAFHQWLQETRSDPAPPFSLPSSRMKRHQRMEHFIYLLLHYIHIKRNQCFRLKLTLVQSTFCYFVLKKVFTVQRLTSASICFQCHCLLLM